MQSWLAVNWLKFESGGDREQWGKKTDTGELAIIANELNKSMTASGISYEAFLADADRRGILLKDKNSRTKTVKFNGKTVRCVVFKESVTGGHN